VTCFFKFKRVMALIGSARRVIAIRSYCIKVFQCFFIPVVELAFESGPTQVSLSSFARPSGVCVPNSHYALAFSTEKWLPV
jgi:hypothetical protein